MVADCVAQKLNYSGFIRLGLFPERWRSANVTPSSDVPHPQSSDVTTSSGEEHYRPISIIPILSKVHSYILGTIGVEGKKACNSVKSVFIRVDSLSSSMRLLIWDDVAS